MSELSEWFSVSRKTAHKWIGRFFEDGERELKERSRRPHSSPNQTLLPITTELLTQKRKHPSWGARKMRLIVGKKYPEWRMPAEVTINRLFEREGLVKKRRRRRRLHPGCPQSKAREPNDIWAADYKGQFRLRDGSYCFGLTVSDLFSRYLLGCGA